MVHTYHSTAGSLGGISGGKRPSVSSSTIRSHGEPRNEKINSTHEVPGALRSLLAMTHPPLLSDHNGPVHLYVPLLWQCTSASNLLSQTSEGTEGLNARSKPRRTLSTLPESELISCNNGFVTLCPYSFCQHMSCDAFGDIVFCHISLCGRRHNAFNNQSQLHSRQLEGSSEGPLSSQTKGLNSPT